MLKSKYALGIFLGHFTLALERLEYAKLSAKCIYISCSQSNRSAIYRVGLHRNLSQYE